MATAPDPNLQRITEFFETNKAPVFIKKISGGYSIYMTEDKTPVARLRLSGGNNSVEVLWWRHQEKWASIGDFGGIICSLDEALEYVMDDPLESFWPY
jgi:hypothetical protein